MKKTDVTFHSDGFRPAHAAVNVKIRWPYAPARDQLIDCVGSDHGGDRAHMPAWRAYVAGLSDEVLSAWENAAASDGWDQSIAVAREVFGAGHSVYSEGRSSGWAVVAYNERITFDREDVAAWDAVALARWAKFARAARDLADDIPYQTLSLIYINVYEAEADRRDAAAEIAGADPFGLAVTP